MFLVVIRFESDNMAKESKFGQCRLCHNMRDLQKSHIIPAFFYEPLFSSGHFMGRFSSSFGGRIDAVSDGIKERLLCEECEHFLNREFETYARNMFFGNEPLTVTEEPTKLYFGGIDYARFKLFLISLFWRMGVATNPFFEIVKLGPHEPRMREMILNKIPGPPHEYGCIVSAIERDKPGREQTITTPFHSRIEGQNVYKIVIAGYAFAMLVSNRSDKLSRQDYFIREDGILRIDMIKAEQIRFLVDTYHWIAPIQTRGQFELK